MVINLISRNNGVGLSRDVQLITDILSIDHTVIFREYGTKPDPEQSIADLNIFVELVSAVYFNRARSNIVVPNPEWYDLRWRQYIPRFSSVFCKTKHAIAAFQMLNRRCQYVSFTSEDRLVTDTIKDDNQWLHVAGKSGQKGTDVIFKTWADNPDFPHLTVVQDPGKAKERPNLSNITPVYRRMDECELKQLQNKCGVHLCPSETEGFGHYIMEAMSCRSTVVTTDGPPMNELVTPDRGVLIDWETKTRQRFAQNYLVTPKTMAEAVKKVMNMTHDEHENIRAKARMFYEENDVFFRKTFRDAINQLAAIANSWPNREVKNEPKPCTYPLLETRRFLASYPRTHNQGKRRR